MLYYDVRLSETFPTVELRVPDVCTELDDTVLVALLARAMVTTAAESGGAEPWRSDLLRAATWRASRYGIAGPLVHPGTRELAPTREVVDALLAEVADALEHSGDSGLVRDLVERLFARGGGSARQRAVHEAQGSLDAVVRDLSRRTEESWE
jgi:carboxylate-amine ligase